MYTVDHQMALPTLEKGDQNAPRSRFLYPFNTKYYEHHQAGHTDPTEQKKYFFKVGPLSTEVAHLSSNMYLNGLICVKTTRVLLAFTCSERKFK